MNIHLRKFSPAYFTDKSFINILLEENNYHDSDNPIIILFNLKI